MVRRGRLLLVAALALAASACTGGGGSAAPEAPTSTAAPTSASAPRGAAPASSAPGVGCDGFHGTDGARSSVGPAVPGLLVDATAGENGCLDQVEFTFRSEGDGNLADQDLPPGYTAGYAASNQFADGAQQIALDGNAWLDITMKPAASVDTTDPAHPVAAYRGNLLLRYGAHHHLVIVRELPDGDGAVHWVIGLDGRRPFAVDAARDPTRITVYIG